MNSACAVVGLTTLLCVVLRVTGVIDWGWAFVLAPLWIPAVSLLIAILAAGVFFDCEDLCSGGRE